MRCGAPSVNRARARPSTTAHANSTSPSNLLRSKVDVHDDGRTRSPHPSAQPQAAERNSHRLCLFRDHDHLSHSSLYKRLRTMLLTLLLSFLPPRLPSSSAFFLFNFLPLQLSPVRARERSRQRRAWILSCSVQMLHASSTPPSPAPLPAAWRKC